MTLYNNKTFTLPTNTNGISDALYAYRVGNITKEDFYRLVGHWPDDENEPVPGFSLPWGDNCPE